jgi:hypothetical protein
MKGTRHGEGQGQRDCGGRGHERLVRPLEHVRELSHSRNSTGHPCLEDESTVTTQASAQMADAL